MLTMKSSKRQLGYGQEMKDAELGEAESCRSQSTLSAEAIPTRFGQFSGGYDEGLMAGAEDQAHLEALGERERESDLCDRTLKREKLLCKWGIKCILVAKEKNKSIVDGSRDVQDVAVAVKHRSSTRRRNAKARRVANKRRTDRPESGRESDGQHQNQFQYHDHHLKEHEQAHAAGKKSRPKTRDKHRTRRVLQVQHGVQLRNVQMDAVSNLPVINTEFTSWLDACERDAQALPSVSSIDKKQTDIGHLELMVQTDRKPVSGAYPKRYMLVDCNEVEKAALLENQIKQIEEQPETLDSARMRSMESAIESKPQCMPFRYKKLAHLNRLEDRQREQARLENAASISVGPVALPVHMEERVVRELEVSEESNLDMLDLYELHNFDVNLDLSKLMQFSEIFNEIEGAALDAGAQ